ncbi:MAG: hypothetical protein K0Q64_248 [Nitrobacter vulgaris]|nr:hypothetical protein [Nitrobacter vulgaris]
MSVIGFPLLLIPLAICNIIVFLMPGVLLTEPVLTLTLMSGVPWLVTLGDTLLALGIVLLLFEIIKGVASISPTICCRWWCSGAPRRNS